MIVDNKDSEIKLKYCGLSVAITETELYCLNKYNKIVYMATFDGIIYLYKWGLVISFGIGIDYIPDSVQGFQTFRWNDRWLR